MVPRTYFFVTVELGQIQGMLTLRDAESPFDVAVKFRNDYYPRASILELLDGPAPTGLAEMADDN